VLTRNLRFEDNDNQQEVPVSLDTSNTETGYLLGRLFSVLENIQTVALGNVNASITDRYYASASAVPQQVFFLLLKGAKNNISRARKTSDKNLIYSLESKMGEIIGTLDGNFPKALSAEEQSWFAIGYYHQRYAHHGSKASKDEAVDITDETLETIE